MKYSHIPVLKEEVLEYLRPNKNENFIDATLGGGGYTLALSKKVGSGGKIISIDLDELAIKNFQKIAKKEKITNVILANDNFRNLHKIVESCISGEEKKIFSGVVFDLGLSSAQLEDRSRGFSFQLDDPLDMGFSHAAHNTQHITSDILNKYNIFNLEKIIREYGEEKYARLIAGGIVKYREDKSIERTKELVDIIEQVVPKSYKNKKIHCATRTFQALRIATNDELTNIELALPQALDLLKVGGRIAVVSFHSLEEKIIKQFTRNERRDCICPKELPICQCDHRARIKKVNKKIILPSSEEIKNNPKARSAKLRVFEKI